MPDECSQSSDDESDNQTGKLDLGVAPACAHDHRHDLAGGFFLSGHHRLLNPLLLFVCKEGFCVHFITSPLKLPPRQSHRPPPSTRHPHLRPSHPLPPRPTPPPTLTH